jgi:transcriptional regulator
MTWYQPKHFAVAGRAHLLEAMRAHPFATLVSVGDGAPSFTHLPLEVEEAGESLRLLGHLAKANPHWQQWRDGEPVTALFHGPNAYVAPAWYSVREAVPTWNYVVVHAHGPIRVTHDSAAKERLLKTLIGRHDPPYRAQWDELGEAFRERMKQGIVGITIDVARLEGKFKLSQNRPAVDRAAVQAAHAAGDAPARALADWMVRLGIADQTPASPR